MDLIRTSLKVSAAALLTAPVLLTPYAATNHYGSSPHRFAAHPAPMIPTHSLDRAMHALVGQFNSSKEATGTILASVLPAQSSLEQPADVATAPIPARSAVEAPPISILAPTVAEAAPAPLVPPGPTDALSAIASPRSLGTEKAAPP